jgi:hypothetical protein
MNNNQNDNNRNDNLFCFIQKTPHNNQINNNQQKKYCAKIDSNQTKNKTNTNNIDHTTSKQLYLCLFLCQIQVLIEIQTCYYPCVHYKKSCFLLAESIDSHWVWFSTGTASPQQHNNHHNNNIVGKPKCIETSFETKQQQKTCRSMPINAEHIHILSSERARQTKLLQKQTQTTTTTTTIVKQQHTQLD